MILFNIMEQTLCDHTMMGWYCKLNTYDNTFRDTITNLILNFEEQNSTWKYIYPFGRYFDEEVIFGNGFET